MSETLSMTKLEASALLLQQALIERFQTVTANGGEMCSKAEAQALAAVLGFSMCVMGEHNVDTTLDGINKMIDEVIK